MTFIPQQTGRHTVEARELRAGMSVVLGDDDLAEQLTRAYPDDAVMRLTLASGRQRQRGLSEPVTVAD